MDKPPHRRMPAIRILFPANKGFSIWRWGLFLGFVLGVACLAAVVVVYGIYAPSVPHFESIADYQPKVGTRIYSVDDQLIGEFAAEQRHVVPAKQIPKRLYQAFMAAEDKRFYRHGGIDFLGVMQALLDKIKNPKSKLRGASTITQQVAKSLLVGHQSYAQATERTLARKIREAILARRLEAVLSKDQILYMYMTQIFLGHKAYGVQSAAENYFRKNVWELSLAEMATLAGLPQRPSDYSPWSRPKAAHARRRYVLRRMLAAGFISQAEHDEARDVELEVFARRAAYTRIAPYFTEEVRRRLIRRYGEEAVLKDGFEVYTTLDLEKQAAARNALRRGLLALDKRQGFRGPLRELETKSERASFAELSQKDKIENPNNWARSQVAQVVGFAKNGKWAKLDIAGEEGFLPLAGMRWARTPNPVERVDYHYLRDVRDALKVGDVVEVASVSKKQLSWDPHGAQVADHVPKEGALYRLVQDPIAQGALLSVDPKSGHVVAQVGGLDFRESSYNRASQACREPGSAFKPVVYSAAIDKLDFTPSTLVDDKPIVFDDPTHALRWKPNNAGMRFRGSLPLRTCLKDSINTPAIRIANAVGIDDVIKNARRLGIETALKRELGTALGSSCTTLDALINVYITLNRYGLRQDKTMIRRVLDRYGNILEDHSAPWDPTLDLAARMDRAYLKLVEPEKRALDPQTAFLMVRLLRNVIEEGTGRAASRSPHAIAGKTGTTNDSYDAWFMGFTQDLVTGVWVGHDRKERPLGVGEYGGKTALPVWMDYTLAAFKDHRSGKGVHMPQPEFIPPDGVVEVRIDPETGLLARPGSLVGVSEFYREGTEPAEYVADQSTLDPEDLDMFDADVPL